MLNFVFGFLFCCYLIFAIGTCAVESVFNDYVLTKRQRLYYGLKAFAWPITLPIAYLFYEGKFR